MHAVIPPPSFGSDVATGVTFGNYVVGELIGRGAMASVYRAEHVMLNKAVALKLMDRSLLDSPDARERFLREGRVVASITHPNVVNITDVGVHEGTPYLVMELLVGEDLHSHLTRHAPLDDRATTRLALPLIAALSAAHDAGVVHRDVKPSNIFLEQGSNGEVIPKVLDFGISKLSLERTGIDLIATSPNQLIGSPLYLAPEALRGPGQLGPASDQYSLGVVLYECVTGRTPFQGDTLMALLGALARGAHAPPSALRPDISPALERVIERAMALDPKERFPSLRDMGSALLGLAAARTQVVWANSFKKLALDEPLVVPPSVQPLVHRPPSGRLALPGPASTPLPPLRQPLGQRLKSNWIALVALAVGGAVALGSLLLDDSPPKGARLATGAVASAPANDSAPARTTLPGASASTSPSGSPPAIAIAEAAPKLGLPPGPLPAGEAEEASPADSSVASSAPVKSTRVHALQPSRRKSASAARERRSRSRRPAVTATAGTGRTETSETSTVSRNEPAQPSLEKADEEGAPAASESGQTRRGANQSPYLD